MINDNELKIEEPKKLILDFLDYLEKETPIIFEKSTLSEEFLFVKSTVNGITISMPAQFYTLNVANYPMEIELRYCPCECCHKVVYVKLLINDKVPEFTTANIVMRHIKKAVPDMQVYIIKKEKTTHITNNPADYQY